MSQDVPPSRGLVAGKYELLRLIGKGGMGSVWEGRHTSLGTRVAIKFIEKEYADNDEARKRFDNEARAAAALQSKHAIQIHDHGVTEDGKPYIVMEMLVGEPLDKRLERLRVLPLRDAAVILQQVCRGLQKAHEHGIVHRDLKPENIFLVKSPDDDDETAKVLDFGIAKIRTGGADQNISANTRTGAVLGTPFYMSPEQARGLRDIDHRSDLWSIGVIAFKCVTGRLPFEGESLGDLLVKICTVPIPVPSHVNPQLPPSFDAWFSRALDRDPNRRFGSAHELAEALAYAAGLSVRHGAPSASVPGYAPVAPAPGTGTAMGGMSPAPYGAQPYTPQPYNATPAPYAPPMNVTSAPYVTSATTSGGGSKAAYVFAAFVALVGIGLGGWGGWAFLHGRAEASPGDAPTATATTPEAPTAVVTPLATTATTTPAATATASATSETPAATAKSTPGGAHHATHAHHTTTHPTATSTSIAPTATSTATVTYTVTPPPKPTSTHTGDFGAGF